MSVCVGEVQTHLHSKALYCFAQFFFGNRWITILRHRRWRRWGRGSELGNGNQQSERKLSYRSKLAT